MRNIQTIFLVVALLLMLSAFQRVKPKKLFLLGDSISLQYGTYLETEFKGKFVIERKGSQENALKNLDVPIEANGGDSRMVLDYLLTKNQDPNFDPDLMLLNCRLHDIKRNPSTKQIAIDSLTYRENLEAIYQIIHRKKIQLVWIRSTEVVDSLHAAKSKAFERYASDLEVYNSIADEVFSRHGVPIIDLYAYTKALGTDRFADHVHYIPRVIKAQASYIATFVNSLKY